MPRFDTPQPIELELELSVAEVRIDAGERAETVVEVRPERRVKARRCGRRRADAGRGRSWPDPGQDAAKSWRAYNPFGNGGSVDVRVELPAGSRVAIKSAMGAVRCSGPLAESQIKTGLGDIDVERADSVRLTTGMGDIDVGQVTGAAELSTGSGDIRAGELSGATKIKNANGDVRVAEAVQGSVSARTGFGQIEVGIPYGTAAWLDLSTGYGEVRNGLDRSGPPEPGEESVEVRAHSGYGDITIARAYPDAS